MAGCRRLFAPPVVRSPWRVSSHRRRVRPGQALPRIRHYSRVAATCCGKALPSVGSLEPRATRTCWSYCQATRCSSSGLPRCRRSVGRGHCSSMRSLAARCRALRSSNRLAWTVPSCHGSDRPSGEHRPHRGTARSESARTMTQADAAARTPSAESARVLRLRGADAPPPRPLKDIRPTVAGPRQRSGICRQAELAMAAILGTGVAKGEMA